MNGNAAAESSGMGSEEDPSRATRMDMSQGFGNLSGQVSDMFLQTINNPLLDWYVTKDGPWDPISKNMAVAAPTLYRTQSRSVGPRNVTSLPHSFSQYRNHVPSETSTIPPSILPSDSGYVSGSRHSVGIPSVSGDLDRATDTQSLVGPMTDFGLQAPAFPNAEYTPTPKIWARAREKLAAVSQQPLDAETNHLVCPVCNASCRTRSELKKHDQRHTKPHICPEPGCSRKYGFSTANDLARHRRCRHPNSQAAGQFFRCHLGACANKDKAWPRADNFKSHLKRLHHFKDDDDLEPFIVQGPSLRAKEATHTDEPRDNDHMELNMSSVATDPAAIQSLTLGAIGSGAELSEGDHHVDDEHMAIVEGGFAHDASLMVGGQFSGLSTIEDGCDQDEAPHEKDNRTINLSEEDLHMSQVVAPRQLTRGTPVSEFVIPVQVSQAPARDQSSATGALNFVPTTGVVVQGRAHDGFDTRHQVVLDSSEERISAPVVETSFVPEGSEDSDHDCQSDDHLPVDRSELDAPGEVDTSLDVGAQAESKTNDEPEEPGEDIHATTVSDSLSFSATGEDDEHTDDEARNLANSLKYLKERGKLDKIGLALQEFGLLEVLGLQNSKLPASKLKKPPTAQSASRYVPRVSCPEPGCNKSFNRECELTKHMKRHEKPYGCTFLDCSKKFGSKSDWKRHENSQHHELDSWKCDEKAKNGLPRGGEGDPRRALCGKVCHRRETFKAHLQKEHGIGNSPPEDAALISKKLDSCRYDRNCDASFWCGFCLRFVEMKKKERFDGWAERYDHIDDHLFGRNVPKFSFEQWRYEGSDDASAAGAASVGACRPPPSVSGSTTTTTTRGAGPYSASLSSSSSPGSVHPGDKRRPGVDDDDQARRVKRPKVDKSRRSDQLWLCCHCQGPEYYSAVLNDQCMGSGNCSHFRCDNCHVFHKEAEE